MISKIRKWWYFRNLENLKKEADKRRLLTKIPQYVMRWGKGLRIFSSREIKAMKKNGRLDPKMDQMKLQQMSVYLTN